MKTTLIVVGKTDSPFLEEGIAIYLKRLKHYINFEFKIIPDIKNTRSLSPKDQCVMEGDLILDQIGKNIDVFLLDERGQQPTSVELSAIIERKMVQGTKDLIFVIGGPYGFSDKVKKRVTSSISLSRLTFSHQMVRLIFVEQLYRAMTIIRGEPYHHE